MSDRIRIGVIGTGLRGQGLIGLALRRDDVEIPAICDIDERMLEMTLARFDEADRRSPKIYSAGEKDYLNLLDKENLDGVIITTPWRWHTPMAIAAMESGKHVGVEVPACLTVDECWNLVRMSEKTEKFCMILENVCYVKFNDGENPYGGGVEYGEKGFSEARWRTQHSIDRNGDLYPTHGGGPVASMLDINRGNRFVNLTSTATQSRGLHQYIVAQAGPDHPNAKVKFKLGDIVTTVIKCAKGQTVVLSHDTNSPRPYSLNFRVQGTRGLWMKDNNSIYIEGLSPEDHKWEPDEPYLKKYDHPLWKRFESKAAGAGHGGMDFFIVRAFLESIKRDVSPPLDVYDAASMSVISPLSEQSIANGSAPMKFPDFTRGKWKTNKPIFALNDVY